MHRGSLSGEGGYYLTVYEAALEYIHNLDVATETQKALERTRTSISKDPL